VNSQCHFCKKPVEQVGDFYRDRVTGGVAHESCFKAARRGTKVYLAGPIFGCSDNEAKDWREAAKERLGEVLDPMVRDYRGAEDSNVKDIVEMDKKDIDQCSHMIAFVPKPSVGTSMEILYAWQQGMQVISVVPNKPVSPWLKYHSTVVTSFEEAFSLLEQK
jgi:nucleoside 2-deoxyribosyltransferase